MLPVMVSKIRVQMKRWVALRDCLPHLKMRKPPVAWKGAAPSKLPVSLEARMACAAIVNNVVVSSSCVTLDLPPALLEHIATPTLAEWAEHDAHQKARRKTC